MNCFQKMLKGMKIQSLWQVCVVAMVFESVLEKQTLGINEINKYETTAQQLLLGNQCFMGFFFFKKKVKNNNK